VAETGGVVVVHERFTELGGSEQVVAELSGTWPRARVFVPIADPNAVPARMADVPILSSGLQNLYRRERGYAPLLPLLPAAMKRADLGSPALVVTSHHAFANRVRVGDEVPMVSYVHTPARWMWDPTKTTGETESSVVGAALRAYAGLQRVPDRRSAARPDLLLANSTAVAERIRRWWGRESVVVPPPVAVDWFTPDPSVPRDDFYLFAGRLVPYKRADLAVRAAALAGVRLVVAGAGRQRGALEAMAGDGVTFLGAVSDGELRDLYRRCRALVQPGEEDFGIIPVEAQACGAPVIGVDAGGHRDTVVDGVTGERIPLALSDEERVADLAEALAIFDSEAFDADGIRRHAEGMGRPAFRRRVDGLVRSHLRSSTRKGAERALAALEHTAAVAG
jgi:glycosyltransferase involved in cell wall biosynthesis